MGKPVVKIVGLGEGGARAIGKIMAAGVGKDKAVSFVAIGNDENLMLESMAKENIFLNHDSTTVYKRISSALRGGKIIIIVTGAGSSAAKKALPQVILCAKNNNATIVSFVNRPFVLENATRKQNAEYCLNVLHHDADTVFDIPAEKFFIFRLNQPQVSLGEIFDVTNDIFAQGVDIFLNMISNSDSFVKWGNASFGYGYGTDPLDSIQNAIRFPLLDQDELRRATKVFVRSTGNNDATTKNFIKSILHPDAKLIWRADNSAVDKIFASIIFSKEATP